jgi:hypothetical protein
MQSALSGAALHDESLLEHAFVFIANAAKCMGTALAGQGAEEPPGNLQGSSAPGSGTAVRVDYLEAIVPLLLETLQESEFVQLASDEEDSDDSEGGEERGGERSECSVSVVQHCCSPCSGAVRCGAVRCGIQSFSMHSPSGLT